VADNTYNGYCVKCKEKRDFEGTVEVSKTGMNVAKGKCPVCGTNMCRILGKAERWIGRHRSPRVPPVLAASRIGSGNGRRLAVTLVIYGFAGAGQRGMGRMVGPGTAAGTDPPVAGTPP